MVVNFNSYFKIFERVAAIAIVIEVLVEQKWLITPGLIAH